MAILLNTILWPTQCGKWLVAAERLVFEDNDEIRREAAADGQHGLGATFAWPVHIACASRVLALLED